MDQSLKSWLLSQAAYYSEYLQPDKSIALLEAVRRFEPKNSDVHRMLSYAYLQADRPEESIRAADRFLKYSGPGAKHRAIKWIRGRAVLRLRRKAA